MKFLLYLRIRTTRNTFLEYLEPIMKFESIIRELMKMSNTVICLN